MIRRMQMFGMGFFLGVIALMAFPVLPPSGLFVLVSLVVILIWPISQNRLTRFLLALMMGFSWALIHSHLELKHRLPPEWVNKPITVVGTITSIPTVHIRSYSSNVQFEFDIQTAVIPRNSRESSLEHTSSLSPYFPKHVQLSWYQQPLPSLHIGERWQFTIQLKQARGLANPGGFDYERWFFQHRMHAVGRVLQKENSEKIASNANIIHHWRQKIYETIQSHTELSPWQGLLTALTIGVQADIPMTQWKLFQATGTNHLVAISGLHIGLVAGLAYGLIGFLWRRSARLILLCPVPIIAALGGWLAAMFYGALAGFGIPTQRALIMLTVFLVTTLRRQSYSLWFSYFLSLFLIVLWDPLAPLAMGFWLSIGAVGFILYGLNNRTIRETSGWQWQNWLRTQAVVTLGLIPLTLLFFQKTSLTAFVANLIAIPWIGFVIVPLSLLGGIIALIIPNLAIFLLKIATLGLAPFGIFLEYLTTWPHGIWSQAIPSWWIFFSLIFGVLLLLAPLGIPGRYFGIVGFFPLWTYSPPTPGVDEVWLTLLDVGQGLSAVVRTQNHVLLYDAGPKLSEKLDSGQMVILPFLQQAGIQKIDRFIISHAHHDHEGGTTTILQTLPVNDLLASTPKRWHGYGAKSCYRGQTWQWDGVTFEILGPVLNHRYRLINDQSCVLRIRHGKNFILLPGDIEKRAEQDLVQEMSHYLSADILIAPHHGSTTSSSENFLTRVKPKVALFPVGYENRYRFPRSVVIDRYRQLGVKILDTVNSGAITFKLKNHLGNPPVTPTEEYRVIRKHYWNY